MRARLQLAVGLVAWVSTPAVARPEGSGGAIRPARTALALEGGYELGDLAGVALRLDAEIPLVELGPRVALGPAASLGYSHVTKASDAGPAVGMGATANAYRIVPAARLAVALGRRISIHADAGVGYWVASLRTTYDMGPFGASTWNDTRSGLVLRLAAGNHYAVSDTIQLGWGVALERAVGGYAAWSDPNTFTILGALRYRP